VTQRKIARPDLEIPVEAWGAIKSATAKLAWFEQVDAAIAAGIVGGSFAQLAINMATNPKGINSQTGLTWRSARTLADNTGLSEPTVDRLMKEAVAAGLLFVVRKGRPGRGGRSTIFRLAMPETEMPSPVRRFGRKNPLRGEAKNPENPSPHNAERPSSVPEKSAHTCQNNTPTSGSELLRDRTPSDLTPQERGSAARSADADRDSIPTNTADTADAAPPNQRAPGGALIGTVAAQDQTPSCNNPMGAAANAANNGTVIERGARATPFGLRGDLPGQRGTADAFDRSNAVTEPRGYSNAPTASARCPDTLDLFADDDTC
jgi:hypothetical protein